MGAKGKRKEKEMAPLKVGNRGSMIRKTNGRLILLS